MVVTMDKKSVHCTIVGDGMVGKTCLAKVFADRTFPDQYVATVKDSYNGLTWFGGDQYSVSITDFAGEHEDGEVRHLSYQKSDVILLCYSVLDKESFSSVREHWAREVRRIGRKCPVLLVALQTDLRKPSTKHITTAEGQKLAREVKANAFVECSARDRTGIKDVFENVVYTCLRYRKRKVNLMKRVLGR